MNIIYWESQVNGLCRLHSINTFFKYKKYTSGEFIKFCNEYDEEKNKLYNMEMSCKSFDLVNSDQQNIISYIIHKNYIYTKYYPINFIYLDKITKDEFYKVHTTLNLNTFFIYNELHIWIIKKYNNKWYEVNSLNGVKELHCIIDVYDFIKSKKNTGYIIPVDHMTYFYKNLELITREIKTKKNIENYLKLKNIEKNILGELEVHLNICIDILKFVLNMKNEILQNTTFLKIKKIVNMYYVFIEQFTNKNYNNIDLILKYVPYILNNLFDMNPCFKLIEN
jgi:hypothetical protein